MRCTHGVCLFSLILVATGCFGEPGATDPTADGADLEAMEPQLPSDFDPGENTELERRLGGECILFDPTDDGVDNPVCLMSTPQDGSLGALTTETEEMGIARADDPSAEDDVGGATEALRDEAPDPLPSSVDHRSYLDGCLSISNQQACGWCAIHATTAAFEALHCSRGCDVPELSEPHLRYLAQGSTPFRGCSAGYLFTAPWDVFRSTGSTMNTLVNYPIADAGTWPYTPNGRGLNASRPDQMTLDGAAVHQATGYSTVDSDDPDDLKEILATEREVVISVPVFTHNSRSGATRTRNDWAGDANVRVPPDARFFGQCDCDDSDCMDEMCLRGYHAVVLTGYDDATKEFTFLNSWGKNWGDGGYGRMSYEFVEDYSRRAAYFEDVDTSIEGNACEDDAAEDPGGDPSMGGAGILPTDCARHGDCAACTTASGCGWCDGSCVDGARAGPTSGSSCGSWSYSYCRGPAPPDPCTANRDCGACVAAAGCAWCASGTPGCFDPSLRRRVCSDPRNAADQCENCRSITDCSDCTARTGCGWCDRASTGVVAPGTRPGNCVSGDADTADRVSCGNYVGTGEACNGNDCDRFTDCTACTQSEHCGWCDGSDTCMAGGFSGPALGGTCGDDWDHFGTFCDNTDSGCGNAASCGECLGGGLSSSMCTWCESSGSCVEAAGSCAETVTDHGSCPGLCGGEYAPCSDASECCDGLACVNGDCIDCGSSSLLGASCDATEPAACCGSLTCSPQSIGGPTSCCARGGDPCTGDGDCCGEMTCSGGSCLQRARGQSCVTSQECPGSSFCTMGTCST